MTGPERVNHNVNFLIPAAVLLLLLWKHDIYYS